MSEDEYRECVRNYRDEFSTYDQYVDVVSCWEEFLENYRPYFSGYCFDRFPSMLPLDGGDPVTPDFSVYFNDSYGIIFEITRTLPPNDDLFDEEMDQIRNYDRDIAFNTGGGSASAPDIHDIVLLVSTTDSQTIEHRIAEFLSSGRLDLESNLIPMEYTYLDQDRKAKYQFKRLSRVEENFRDEELPEEWRLSRKLSMEGGTFDNIYSPVDKFYKYKATGVLCNDRPPELYIACYLWHHVFPSIAMEEHGSLRPAQSISRISVNANDLSSALARDYIPHSSIKTQWIEDALEFLVLADVAEPVPNSRYIVKHRDLRDKRRDFKDVSTERTQIKDLAYLFSEWACETIVSKSSEQLDELLSPTESEEQETSDEERPESGQSGLDDFV